MDLLTHCRASLYQYRQLAAAARADAVAARRAADQASDPELASELLAGADHSDRSAVSLAEQAKAVLTLIDGLSPGRPADDQTDDRGRPAAEHADDIDDDDIETAGDRHGDRLVAGFGRGCR